MTISYNNLNISYLIVTLLMASGLFSDYTYVFAIHDTYFVITESIIALYLTVLFGTYTLLIWLLFYFFQPENNKLFHLHQVLSLICLIILTLNLRIPSAPIYDSDYSAMNNDNNIWSALPIIPMMILLVFLIAQLIFPIALFRAIIKRN